MGRRQLSCRRPLWSCTSCASAAAVPVADWQRLTLLSLNPGVGVKLAQTPFSQVRDFGGNLSIDYPGLSTPHLMWLLLVEMATELQAGMRQTHTLR